MSTFLSFLFHFILAWIFVIWNFCWLNSAAWILPVNVTCNAFWTADIAFFHMELKKQPSEHSSLFSFIFNDSGCTYNDISCGAGLDLKCKCQTASFVEVATFHIHNSLCFYCSQCNWTKKWVNVLNITDYLFLCCHDVKLSSRFSLGIP